MPISNRRTDDDAGMSGAGVGVIAALLVAIMLGLGMAVHLSG